MLYHVSIEKATTQSSVMAAIRAAKSGLIPWHPAELTKILVYVSIYYNNFLVTSCMHRSHSIAGGSGIDILAG
jgi:hypothetical protein